MLKKVIYNYFNNGSPDAPDYVLDYLTEEVVKKSNTSISEELQCYAAEHGIAFTKKKGGVYAYKYDILFSPRVAVITVFLNKKNITLIKKLIYKELGRS